MKRKHYPIVQAIAAAASLSLTGPGSDARAQTPSVPLLPQGAFNQVAAGDKPGGWEIMWGPENVSLGGDGKNRWVQLRDGAALNQVVKLPTRAKTVVVSARLKLSNYEKGPGAWHRARVSLTFQNEKGVKVGDYPAIPDLTANSDWVTKEVTLKVPTDATHLQLQPGLWGSKGVFEIDDLVVKVTEIAPVPIPVTPVDAPWPASAKVPWGGEPVDVQSSKRARVNLNGAWQFSPAQSISGQANAAPQAGWGYMAVPGNWRRYQEMTAKGVGPQWTGFDGKTLAGAWYERRFKVPADWNGRHISIDFQRISTDATFWVNDKPAGKVNWPEGELDITNLVKPGEEVTLRTFVVATIDEGEAMVMMGEAPGQSWTAKKELQSAGIVGNVTLQSRPRGAHVSDVYIQPSVRKKQLGVDIELSGVTQNGAVELVASMVDENGKEEKRFTQTVNATAGATQRVKVNWAWENPRLWDSQQPNLYTLRLSVKGAGLDDDSATRFGFREMWIEGRQVFLNGTPFRMRPTLLGTGAMGGGADSIREARELGYNFGELWPESIEDRSSAVRFTDWYDVADRSGFPISGIMPHMGWMGGNINSPAKEAVYRAATERLMRRYRNHPSIVIWGTSGNMFGAWRDPAYVGTIEASRRVETAKGTPTSTAIPFGELGVRIIKSIDPTRPVFIHNGGSAGDIYTLNNYLNFIPLQEREEWLSSYVQKGQMPLAYVEFGTPVNIGLMRGRNGFQNAYRSENWLTEFASIYLGSEAYRQESSVYRKKSAALFVKDQTYQWSQSMPERDYAPSWMRLQDLFITNTWRSWRTMGMTGGMVPWDRGYARQSGKLTPAGEALRASNSDTLAWITGAAQTGDVAAFTAKDHSYFAGEKIRKQVALLNDARTPQKYSVRWTAVVNNKAAASGVQSGTLAVGETRFVPLEFAAPAAAVKTAGVITLDAAIGENKHTDRFYLRVFPRVAASKGAVSIFDPGGKTSAMLRALGYTVSPWNGKPGPQLLVIGRNALKNGRLPGSLKTFVQSGGRVLLSGHDPHWLRENLGVRVSYHQSRRVWNVGDSGVASGLDEMDLRDWRGHSTLLDPRPDYVNGKGLDVRAGKTTYPYAGWRWGNRGTVASAAIEKPHLSGWRPLMECEFDLAYSPLMELDYGKGKVIWSQLDLEDHSVLDPAAQRVAQQLLRYSVTAPRSPRAATVYIGGAAGGVLLRSLGVQFKSATKLPASGLAIVGPDATIGNAALDAFARGGGKVLFLPRRDAATGAAGLQLQQKADFDGSLQAPNWPEARGLSASDLRWRSAGSAWLASGGGGWQVGADGLLARRQVGRGVMIWSQIDPNLLPADEKTYFRFTRWRQTRALSQVLANLGATFTGDDRIFSPRAEVKSPVIALGGEWRAHQIQRLPASPSADKGHEDKGISAEAKRAVAADFSDADWQAVQAPRDMDSYGGTWANADGEAVFRKTIDVPAALVGQDLKLLLGALDDFDDTYFNGVRVGGIGKENSAPYSVKREYTIPANLIKPGKNVIAVRVWDRFGGGGFTSTLPADLLLQSTRVQAKVAGLYHPDYRDDFELGDEPYRYYNW